VDHELLHQGFFRHLSVEALALYLFLIVVSDQDGRSYYAERNLIDILRLPPEKYSRALMELTTFGLVDYRRPYFWVKNLQPTEGRNADAIPAG